MVTSTTLHFNTWGSKAERDLLATDDIREVSAGSFVDPMMSIEIDEGKSKPLRINAVRRGRCR